jgi:peroxiredoxin
MSKLFTIALLSFLFTNTTFAQHDTELKAGDQSPELKLYREDNGQIQLQDIDSEYILLIFWHYKCSHCQKALTKIDKFLSDEKPVGLKILSIYPFAEEVEKFWSYVNDPLNLLSDPVFIHSTDPKAATRRSFSQKSGQPPLLILINISGKILEMNVKAQDLKEIWKALPK